MNGLCIGENGGQDYIFSYKALEYNYGGFVFTILLFQYIRQKDLAIYTVACNLRSVNIGPYAVKIKNINYKDDPSYP